MTEISLIAATLTGNHGAEAMLTATIARLRERVPGATFNVFTYYPDDDLPALRAGDVRVYSCTPASLVAVLLPAALVAAGRRALGSRQPPPFAESARALARSSLVIDLAGVSFSDGRAKFLPFNALTVLAPALMGVPVVKFAQALGPFRGAANRWVARLTLSRCVRIFARGRASLDHLRALGLSGDRCELADDVAFLLRDDDSLTHCDAEVPPAVDAWRRAGLRVVGICPSSLVDGKARARGDDYAGALATVAARLVQEGVKVVLFPNATRGGSHLARTRNNDLPSLRRVLERIPVELARAGVVAVSVPVNAAFIQRLVSRCDAVLVSRFHAMIAALSHGVPAGVVGWGHKYEEVLAAFSCADAGMDHRRVDPESILALTRKILDRQPGLREAIAAELPRAQARARAQIDFACSVLFES